MEQSIISAACALGAGLCMGIGAIGPATPLAKPWRAWPDSRRPPVHSGPT